MATIEIKVTNGAQVQTITSTMSAGMVSRIMAVYGKAQVQTGVDAQGAPITRPPTNQEILRRWGADMFQTVKYQVQNDEGEAARAAVLPLDMGTPT